MNHKTVSAYLQAVLADDEPREIRLIHHQDDPAKRPGRPHIASHWINGKADINAALSDIERAERNGYNCYVTINPLIAAGPKPIGQGAEDHDIRHRVFIPIDIDRKKAKGDSQRLATAEETAATQSVAVDVLEWFDAEFPEHAKPIGGCSGNGYLILLPCDLENDAESYDTVSQFLAVLADTFDTEAADIDLKVKNASRFCRILGTENRKRDSEGFNQSTLESAGTIGRRLTIDDLTKVLESFRQSEVVSEPLRQNTTRTRTSEESLFDRAKAVKPDAVLQKLGMKVERSGKFLCPAHDDHNPSADFRDKVTRGYHDKWHCWSCEAGGSVIDLVMHKLQLNAVDAARWIVGEQVPARSRTLTNGTPALNGKSEVTKQTSPKIHATADKAIAALEWAVKQDNGDEWNAAGEWRAYHDKDENIVLGVVRFENGKGDKTFRQFRPHNGGWTSCGVQSGIPPFRLVELDKATPLVIVEGEKTCNAVWEIGLQSTTWAGGSKAVEKTDWSMLTGFDVVIWPDADDPGKKAAAEVARALHGVAAKIRILPDDPHATKGEDAADILDRLGREKALTYFEERLAKSEEWTPSNSESPFVSTDETRPEIMVTAAVHETIDACLGVLATDEHVYILNRDLVTISHGKPQAKRSRLSMPGDSPIALKLTADRLFERLSRFADFLEWRRKPGRPRDGAEPEFQLTKIQPPARVLKAIENRGHYPEQFRRMRGIVEWPIIRPDGTIHDRPGYDDATGYVLMPSIELEPIQDKPTQADAEAAAQRLFDVVSDFPFKPTVHVEQDGGVHEIESEAHKAAWLAALLTIVGRPAIEGTCPGFLIDGNAAGTGKSKLARIPALIASGREPGLYAWPGGRSTHDVDDEVRKLLLTVSAAAVPCLVFDNLPTGSAFGCPSLDLALTASTISGRRLQASELIESSWNTVVIGTGINVTTAADSFRRIWRLRLDTDLERPETRSDFRYADIEGHVLANRAGLLRDALIILRAHAAADRPSYGLGVVDFLEWHRVVRDAVFFATGVDVNAVRVEQQSLDQTAVTQAELLRGLAELFPPSEPSESRPGESCLFTAKEVLDRLKFDGGCDALRAAIESPRADDRLPTVNGLSRVLNANVGTIRNGLRLKRIVIKGQPQAFRLENTRKPPQERAQTENVF